MGFETMEKGAALNVLMLPWLGHGHISPYLELAKKLVARNFKIYLCSTPATLSSVRSKIGKKLSQSIQLVELHLACLPNLPPHYHTTNGLPTHLMDTLKEAFDIAGPSFCQILKYISPDLVIYDLLQPWAPQIASDFNIPAVEFITCSATMASVMYHFFTNPTVEFPYHSTIYYREYESELLTKLLESVRDADRVVRCINQSSKIVLVKTFNEIEGVYADYLARMANKKVVPVGALVQDPVVDNDDDHSGIMQWLNEKEKGSTIFVSFGSEYFLKREDLEEIARGLEICNVNFIWVVRFPKGEDVALEEVLPEGFFERIGNRGKVVNGWAPQARILVHPNTGGFVSHCGWNSVLEGMKFGIPIIAMPMHLDQPVNARLLGDIHAGVEVTRDSNGKLHAKEIAEIINLVLKEEGGEPVRKKAKELQKRIELKGEEEIDALVMELSELCGGRESKMMMELKAEEEIQEVLVEEEINQVLMMGVSKHYVTNLAINMAA